MYQFLASKKCFRNISASDDKGLFTETGSGKFLPTRLVSIQSVQLKVAFRMFFNGKNPEMTKKNKPMVYFIFVFQKTWISINFEMRFQYIKCNHKLMQSYLTY